MNKLLIIALIIVLASVLIFGGCAEKAPAPTPAPAPAPAPAPVKPIELKLGHNSPTTSGSHTGFMEPWAKKVEEATNGRVKITMYPAETLFKAREAVEATTGGITDIAWVVLGQFPGRYPLSEVISLPFYNLPSGTIDGRKLNAGAINSHIFQELYDTVPEIQAEWKEVKLLVLHCGLPSAIWSAKSPVRSLADMKGLKLRAAAGPDLDMCQLLGAAPVNMALPAVYEAAQKGVLDGGSIEWGGILSYRLYEVFPYATNVQLTLSRYALVMNMQKYNSLPPDIQKAIMSVSGIRGAELAGEGMIFGLPGMDAMDSVRAKAKEAGKPVQEVDLAPGELEKWKQVAGQPLWDKWVTDMTAKGLAGKKVLDAASSLVKKYQ